MRREDVERLSALTRSVDELHRRAMERILGRVGNKPPNPQAGWAVRPWWEATVQRIDRDWKLDARSSAILSSQLSELVHALTAVDDQIRPQGLSQEGVGRAMIDEAARLRRAWSVRARRIAVTETTRNLSSDRYRQGLHDPQAMKLWVSERDPAVRPSHVLADNRIPIALSTPFDVGGFPMMFPGDPSGPAQEVVNCRCELKIVGGSNS